MSEEEKQLRETLLKYKRAVRTHKFSVATLQSQEQALAKRRAVHEQYIHDECAPAINFLERKIIRLREEEAQAAAEELLTAHTEAA